MNLNKVKQSKFIPTHCMENYFVERILFEMEELVKRLEPINSLFDLNWLIIIATGLHATQLFPEWIFFAPAN